MRGTVLDEAERTAADIARVAALMRERLGVSGGTLAACLERAGRQLPWRIRRQARRLAEAEPSLEHPRLGLVADHRRLRGAAREVRAHLERIDVADRRKGWWLGVLAGAAFNILLFGVLLVLVLHWKGLI